MEGSNHELEAFRRQWRAEVSARTQHDKESTSGPSKRSRKPPAFDNLLPNSTAYSHVTKIDEDDIESQSFGALDVPGEYNDRLGTESSTAHSNEPTSALEHYEKAVERETQGSLGDSLHLYRKAFRMDHRVDKAYKNKHFPTSSFSSKTTNTNPSNTCATVPSTAHHSLGGHPQNVKELIAGFSDLSIRPSPPIIEGTSPPPCPISELPEEILIHILSELAALDVASFARLAQVCKRMAYLVATEEQTWKRVCIGSDVGFGAMHYQWQREVLGAPLKEVAPDPEDLEDEVASPLSKDAITEILLPAYSYSWHQMFRLRPRIRFNGCYISTVNYMRPGQASASQVSWNSPIHIVTYYRYLRFFRDGTVISLLSTSEPLDVIHHLTKELQETHRGGNAPYLPSIVMQNALRGRWRLTSGADNSDVDLKDAEGDLFVETEGANSKYMYRMKLSLGSAGRTARNNKLAWQGFWNYNYLTDDTSEFTLKNDKAFFFSRVKGYGTGA